MEELKRTTGGGGGRGNDNRGSCNLHNHNNHKLQNHSKISILWKKKQNYNNMPNGQLVLRTQEDQSRKSNQIIHVKIWLQLMKTQEEMNQAINEQLGSWLCKSSGLFVYLTKQEAQDSLGKHLFFVKTLFINKFFNFQLWHRLCNHGESLTLFSPWPCYFRGIWYLSGYNLLTLENLWARQALHELNKLMMPQAQVLKLKINLIWAQACMIFNKWSMRARQSLICTFET